MFKEKGESDSSSRARFRVGTQPAYLEKKKKKTESRDESDPFGNKQGKRSDLA